VRLCECVFIYLQETGEDLVKVRQRQNVHHFLAQVPSEQR